MYMAVLGGNGKLYHIAGNFRGRKHLQIGKKYDFHRENFHGLLACAVPKDATPPNFVDKTFANSHKTVEFAKVSSLESFPLYGIMCLDCVTYCVQIAVA